MISQTILASAAVDDRRGAQFPPQLALRVYATMVKDVPLRTRRAMTANIRVATGMTIRRAMDVVEMLRVERAIRRTGTIPGRCRARNERALLGPGPPG